jgi:aspartyl protease family protein
MSGDFDEQKNPWRKRAAPRGRRPGIGMIIVGWGLALVFVTMLFSEVLQQRHNPNIASRLEGQTGELVLRRNAAGHYLAEGTLNGVAATFLLDTGATSVAVPRHIADRLGLEPGAPVQLSTANGLVRAHKTRIADLRIGPLHLSDIAAVIAPQIAGGEILLGMSALSRWDFSQSGDTLTLRPAGY